MHAFFARPFSSCPSAPTHRPGAWALGACWLAALALSGCASGPPTAGDWAAQLQQWQGTPVLLLGEQHDAPSHQAWQQDSVDWLARQDRLAALVLEMAPSTGSTRGLAPTASDSEVQAALHWQDAAWPWQRYRAVVMAAVRADVPVLGGNLPRAQMRDAMHNTALEQQLKPEGWQRQIEAIRQGHCDLLPQSQWIPMARIQLARDQRMASVAQSAMQPGRTVVLVAGRGHVLREVGIPQWLGGPGSYKIAIAQSGAGQPAQPGDADWWQATPALPDKDHCAQLRQDWQARTAPAPVSGAAP